MTRANNSNIRLTPRWVVELARDALGGSIDLDPCTEGDNPTGATVFFTEDSPLPDGVLPPGSAWVNPPWGPGQILRWAQTCIGRRDPDPVLFFTPTDPRTKWFKYLSKNADHLIILTKKIDCYAPELDKYVEPSRGAYIWARYVDEARLACFAKRGHLVLPLRRG